MRVTTGSFVLLVVLFLSAACFSQLPSSRCDSSHSALEDCTLLTQFEPVQGQTIPATRSPLDHTVLPPERSEAATQREPNPREATIAPPFLHQEGFHWRRALS